MYTLAKENTHHPLIWIKPELDITIKSIHRLLHAYTETMDSDAALNEIDDNLHLLRGSLEILEFYAVALLIESMQNAIRTLLTNSTVKKEDVFESLLQATLALEAYINKLHKDQYDSPLSLLPVMNDIRAAIKEPLLSESALFLPNLSIVPKTPGDTPEDYNETCLSDTAKSLRPYYQAALLTWYRDPSDQLSMQQMKLIARNIESSSLTPRNRQIWWIMGGLYEALADKGLKSNISLKLLLAQVDRILKSLSQDDTKFYEKSPPVDLLKNALFYISQATSNGERIKTLKQAYNLNNVIPCDGDISSFRKDLRSPNSESLQAIAKELKKSLDQVKSTIDNFARNTPEDTDKLSQTVIPLKHIADTMSLINQGNQKRLLKSLINKISDIVASSTPPDKESMLEIASTVLHIESELKNIGSIKQKDDLDNDLSQISHLIPGDNTISMRTRILPEAEYRLLVIKIVEEAKNNIVEIKNNVLAHLSSDEKRLDTIKHIPDYLSEIRGSMIIINNRYLPQILKSLLEYVNNDFLTNISTKSSEEYDAFAEALVSIEYYLEAISEERNPSAEILDITCKNLKNLGYSVNSAKQVSKSSPGIESLVTHINEAHARFKPGTSSITPTTIVAIEKNIQNNILSFSVDESDPEVREIFIEEAYEELASMDSSIKSLKLNPGDIATLSNMRRIFHTLKGSGKVAGAHELSIISSATDDYLALVLCKSINIDQLGVDLFSDAHQLLYKLVESYQNKTSSKTDSVHFQNRIHQLIRKKTEQASETGTRKTKNEKPDILEEFFTTTEILETPPVNQNNNSEIEQTTEKTDTQSNPNNTVSAENPTTDINLSLDGSFELIDIFMEEALELIEKGHEKISDTREIDTPFLTSIQRLLHTMKGSARMAGVTSIGDIAHMLESVFENVISKSIPLPTTLAQLTQETLDAISDMVEDAQAGTDLRIHKELISKLEKASRPEIADETIAETSDEINDRARDEAVTGFSETQPNELTEAYKQPDIKSPSVEIEIGDTKQREEILEAHIKPTKPRTTSDPIKVDATMLDQLVNFATEEGAIACRIADHVTGTKSSLFELDKAISRTLMQMRDLQFESNTSRSEHESTGTDNLNLSSFTESQKVAQRLMESIGDIENLHSSLTRLALETDNLVQQQKKIHNQLHENLLGTRMITFSVQTQRMQRILRQTCGELNKKAELILEGTDGSIDRTMLETAMGPLEHIIRNAIAHGIEQPKDRKKKHKPETGSVKVSFSRDKSEHLIIISDDGAGLDLKSIRKKALAKKLISANNKYSDEDIANLIFERGFTTSKEISQISGRGIGMDVVLNTIHELGGSVSISTKRNQGSTFTIRFPFTLSRNHTLIINAGKNTYALPSSSIEHSIPVSLTELENLYEAGLPKFKFNSQDYPLWYIDTLLNNSATRLPPASGHANVILIKFGQKRVALHVDSIADTRDTVLKPNSPQLSNVSGIAGATVLGDGKVILIIDVPSLTKLAEASVKKQRQFLPADEANKNSTTIKTMVVDDSITVRKVTERFLGRNGITALLAKDGLEALEVLEKETPDIILLDIEMPNMDGLELAEKIKSEARLHDVPIIMITSRTGKQHRHAASQIGVDVFLGKPYQESELLGYIQSLTGKRISR